MCAADWAKGKSGAAANTGSAATLGMLRKRMPAPQAAAFTRAPQTASRATGIFGSSTMLTGGSTMLSA